MPPLPHDPKQNEEPSTSVEAGLSLITSRYTHHTMGNQNTVQLGRKGVSRSGGIAERSSCPQPRRRYVLPTLPKITLASRLESALITLHFYSTIFPELPSLELYLGVPIAEILLDGPGGGSRLIPMDRSLEVLTDADVVYLTQKLPELIESLGKSLAYYQDPPLLSDAMTNLIGSIRHEAHLIQAATKQRSTTVMQSYRRIGPLFQKLKENLEMGEQNNISGGLPKALFDHLRLPSYYIMQQSISKIGQTCDPSILPRLRKWLFDSQSRRILWVNGFTGTGKTTIAHMFCEDMHKQKLLAACYFCTCTASSNRQRGIDRNEYQIIPIIARQLAQYSIPFLSELSDVIQQNPEAGSNNLRQQFEQLLNKPLQKVKHTLPDSSVVVVDDLDRCADRRTVELILNLFCQYAPEMNIKFLVTSRPMTDMHTRITTSYDGHFGADFLYLDNIDRSLVWADITNYLQDTLQHLRPSNTDREQLMERFGLSFLLAVKLVSYIRSPQELSSQQKRLKSLIDTTLESSYQPSFIDSTYLDVLRDGADYTDVDGAEVTKMVLQAVLLAHEPLKFQTIGMLAGISNRGHIIGVLNRLQSVLDNSKMTGLVTAPHPAFLEFIFSKERAGPYFCSPAEHGHVLARRCFLEMKKKLRFNICKLESSFLLDKEVKDIRRRIENRVSPTLAYACCHWADHLASATNIDSTLTMLGEFLICHFLFWVEVLNLLGKLKIAISALLQVKIMLEKTNSPPELINLLNEAYMFVRAFAGSSISHSTPHIYISSLQLCPSSSALYQVYSRRICSWLNPPKTATKYRGVPSTFQSYRVGSGVSSAAYSFDGSKIALGCENGTISICDAHTGLTLAGPLGGHSDWVRCVVFSPNGAYILSASSDCTIRKWDATNGASLPASFQGHTHPVKSVAFSPDGTRVVSGSWDNTVRIWNAQDGKPVTEPWEGHKWGVNCVAFSPNNISVASGANDHTIRLWELISGILTAQILEGHANAVTSVAFTPEGSRLVSGSIDCSICIWDVNDGSLTTRFLQSCTHMVYSVAISPDGRFIASGSSDSTVKVWDIDTGSVVFGPMGHSSGVRTVAFSPDGTRLLSGSHESVRNWNLQIGQVARNVIPSPEGQPANGPLSNESLNGVGDPSGVSEDWIASLPGLPPKKRASRPPVSVASLAWFLERSQQAYIPEDLTIPIDAVPSFEPNRIFSPLPERWERKSDGWLVNSQYRLLFWLPETHDSCHALDDTDRHSRLIYWWLGYQELVGDQWPA